MLKNILSCSLNLDEKIKKIQIINNTKEIKGIQCIYAITNDSYKNYI